MKSKREGRGDGKSSARELGEHERAVAFVKRGPGENDGTDGLASFLFPCIDHYVPVLYRETRRDGGPEADREILSPPRRSRVQTRHDVAAFRG